MLSQAAKCSKCIADTAHVTNLNVKKGKSRQEKDNGLPGSSSSQVFIKNTGLPTSSTHGKGYIKR